MHSDHWNPPPQGARGLGSHVSARMQLISPGHGQPRAVKLEETLRILGGIATRDQLLSAGFPRIAIMAALRAGTAIRIRRGWFGLSDTPFAHRVAIELGGRVGGPTAARSYGIWAGEDRDIHVSWAPHGNMTRSPLRELNGVVRHWRILPEVTPRRQSWRESVEQTTAQILLSCDRSYALAAVDSALHLGLLSEVGVDAIFSRMPSRLLALRDAVDGGADSGLESIVRLWLLDSGLPLMIHPSIIGLEVDLLVGQSLVIEVDGKEFHAGAEAFENDRQRDAALGSVGCIVIRFSYAQVMHDRPSCVARIREHLARGDHRRPLRVALVPSPEFRAPNSGELP